MGNSPSGFRYALLLLVGIIAFAIIGKARFSFGVGPILKRIDFETEIRPLLIGRCVACHGPAKAESGIRLDAKQFVEDEGPAVLIPSNPDDSPLVQRIESNEDDLRMPPPGHDPLSRTDQQKLRQWIREGAFWPESDADRKARDTRRDHWAWQQLRNTEIPFAESKAHHPIDRLIEKELLLQGISPSPEAPARELVRRLYIDLTGLPPTAEQVQAYVQSTEPDAYERLLDELLASPDYGERWAQHWLDIAHYADTHGFERDQKREFAWRYRDYVIRAFASDKPYDLFLKEQIAGDALTPTQSESTVATGFLAAGPWDFVGQEETPSPMIKRQARADDLDDMLTQILTSTCGVTIHCARCHNHKLDPITQREYYALCAILAGTKRANRSADPHQEAQFTEEKNALIAQKKSLLTQISTLENHGLSLADIVGGGDGTGSGAKGLGINTLSGQAQKELLGIQASVPPSPFVSIENRWIDGTAVPNGPTRVTSTGIVAKDLPTTSGQAWDAIRNGPVSAQKSTRIADIDFATEGHSVLGMHANSVITWKLDSFRESLQSEMLQFETEIGYGGRPEGADTFADVRLMLDGVTIFRIDGIGPHSDRISIAIPIPSNTRWLTLVTMEGKDGIGHDQVFFGDARIKSSHLDSFRNEERIAEISGLKSQLSAIEERLKRLPIPDQVYAVQSEKPPEMHLLLRGSPESPGPIVEPGTISCIVGCDPLRIQADANDRERRLALARWLTSSTNPLPPRVLVNRLWHHHFGAGIVDTPNDFGLGGSMPSHPELLDWLALEFARCDYSIKSMHRLLCTSHTYKQSSRSVDARGMAVDAQNRLLWRQNSRRLEAETLRDCVLAVTHRLSSVRFGPGYQDFDYQEEYAPIYKYQVADRPELWKRSIYRFVVRTTPHPFLTPLDCPDPANLTPKRNITTTAVQSLALWNNEFMIRQSRYLAESIARSVPQEQYCDQLFHRVLSRPPSPNEQRLWNETWKQCPDSDQAQLMSDLSRALLNSNEFVFVD